jgi:hypothetical protein
MGAILVDAVVVLVDTVFAVAEDTVIAVAGRGAGKGSGNGNDPSRRNNLPLATIDCGTCSSHVAMEQLEDLSSEQIMLLVADKTNQTKT